VRPRPPGNDLLSRLNSIQLRHADIKNRDFRMMYGYHFNGFPTISGFRDNFEVRYTSPAGVGEKVKVEVKGPEKLFASSLPLG